MMTEVDHESDMEADNDAIADDSDTYECGRESCDSEDEYDGYEDFKTGDIV